MVGKVMYGNIYLDTHSSISYMLGAAPQHCNLSDDRGHVAGRHVIEVRSLRTRAVAAAHARQPAYTWNKGNVKVNSKFYFTPETETKVGYWNPGLNNDLNEERTPLFEAADSIYER